MNKPNLFILGAPKCGTTSMAHYLNQHPNVFVSAFKEPHYFNLDSNYRFTFSEIEYLKNFKTTEKYKYYVDASVWYMYSDVAIDEILKFNPNSKFIVMLRNPVEMFYSLHQQLLFSGIENEKSPLTAWDLQEKRKCGKKVPYACRDKSFLQYEKVCKLGVQVKKILSKVDAKDIYFIPLNDMKDNPDRVYKDLQTFLKLEITSLPSYEIINEKKEKRIKWVSNVFAFVNKLKIRLKIRKGLGFANLISSINKKSTSDLYIEEFYNMKDMLYTTFEEDLKLLENLIEKDIR